MPDTTDNTAPERLALGELLDSLAVLCHKVNNPLTSLLGRVQMLKLRAGEDPQVDKAAQVIEESGKRIAAYVREMSQLVCDGKDAVSAATAGTHSSTSPPGSR